LYRYIGNKTKLLPYIVDKVQSLIGEEGTVADVMAGTGSVSFELRKKGYKLISSDMMTYSYHHLVVNLLLGEYPQFKGLNSSYESVLRYLNELPPREGFFYKEFSPNGNPSSNTEPRKYFTSNNASRIDAIREQINEWISEYKITPFEESLLKHTLIMAVNDVANISGTYGYFLSSFKKTSLADMMLKPEELYSDNYKGHLVYKGFAEDVATNISSDLCYLDPPYMKRQYAANYHILETVARGDFPDAIGKSGLRDWWDQHSKLCTKTKGLQSFETIIGKMNCPKFLISYSEDGLFTLDQLIECFSKFGEVYVDSIDYNRFKSNDSKLPPKLQEYLITVIKNN